MDREANKALNLLQNAAADWGIYRARRESREIGIAYETVKVAKRRLSDHIEAQERRIEELENAVRMADENIGWVTDASADRRVKEILRKALGGLERG